ncbi:MAG: hypothetical protein WC834_02780, partial [Eubacteriales bacterium]
MPRKMASGVVADPTAILGIHPVCLWLRWGRRLASCHFSTSGSVLGPCWGGYSLGARRPLATIG